MTNEMKEKLNSQAEETTYDNKQSKDKRHTRGKAATNRDIALTGVFTALAMILSYLESLVPVSLAVPGIKLGLANLVTIVALYKLSVKQTFIISVGRILLSGVLFGNMMIIIYSLAGATLSILVMVAVRRLRLFTATGVSICGAVAHNLGQLIVAVIVLENINIMYYMAVLAIAGALFGAVIGVLAGMIIKNIRF